MKKIILAGIVTWALAMGTNVFAVTETLELLPSSQDFSVQLATATRVTVVVVSSTTPTWLDSTANTALNTALGATVKRAELQIQNTGSVAFYVNTSSSSFTTATGGWYVEPGSFWTFAIGKAINYWALSAASATTAGEARVGALGWR